MAAAPLPGGVNPLDFLYKLSTQRGISAPVFKQVAEQGPAHMKTFVWHCTFHNVAAQGTGRSKKEAKVAAARAIRNLMDFNTLPEPPSYQSTMEKKRKKAMDKAEKEGEDDKPSKKKRYDYSRHFHVYGPGPRFPGGPGPFMPYGYPMDEGTFMGGEGFEQGGPAPIDPMGFDPFTGQEGDGDEMPPRFSGGEFMNPNFGGFYSDTSMMMSSVENEEEFTEQRTMMENEQRARMSRGFLSRLSKLDKYVIKKHKEVYPKEGTLKLILDMVTHTEEAMVKVGEELNNGDGENKIDGLVRVGDLSKGLLLAADRAVNLVMLCKSPPTSSLLQIVHKATVEKLKEVAPTEAYEVHCFEEEAGFSVVKMAKGEDDEMELPYACNITLTSTVIRSNKEEEDGKKDMLAKEKCLQALAELRHSRWFTAMAANLPSCVECIRIVRDLSQRDPCWTSLSDWAIELLVERALFSAFMPMNPAASLMRVMEVVASGLLQEGGNGLKDPCEREDADATATMTAQQKEDITHSAQHYLRLMHFRQIYKVLGIDKDVILEDRRSRHENNKAATSAAEADESNGTPKEEQVKNQEQTIKE